ncbi:SidA/IucD/PvdA family monooxygenase [Brachybacterium sp. MASK1Z-5]|uniref:L-lysine N6-monooxygenase MbtG n=1 Tax=Brachybacterium halotolerans TaxID=2795215 RepID=A0ABS1B7W3_9MICO|nr:SidA/IucD/PvdA family monooxygenase [Brachybacterium halotolerans]MBK0330312.1 SidA/IucD/PvdA family monooxygenase [Brachybacterium halotolerans]
MSTAAPSTVPATSHADDARIHDLVGIGIGPFGLGMAALSEPLEDVDAIFLDQAPGFSWHPGMMLDGATIQVPFLADLVTMADPTSRFSFLQFLKETGRLYPFYIRESFYPLRSEYDRYCRWVAEQLDTLRWRRRVRSVQEEGEHLLVVADVLDAEGEIVGTEEHRGRHVVLGVGTRPALPPALAELAEAADQSAPPVIHSSQYLPAREQLLDAGSVTIVGSGQSAAEIYRDLLEDAAARGTRVDWVTRSPRFFPMEYTKLTLEMTSPEYTDLFRSLSEERRESLGREQRTLYKGISGDLIDDIHELLYRLSQGGAEVPTTLLTDTAVTAARHDAEAGEHVLTLEHGELGTRREHRTRAVVGATGYRSSAPALLAPLGGRIRRDSRGRLDVSRDYTIDDQQRIHVLNAEEHTHGVTAPDLGFGAWRASVVLDAITGREPYPIERRIAFQTFGLPADDA